MKTKFPALTALLFVASVSVAQGDPFAYRDLYYNQIKTVVDAQFNGNYLIGVEVIDSVLGSRTNVDYDEITDPYGTLTNCILFSATRAESQDDSSMFGVFKNGSILWTSDPVIPGSWLGTFATADVNNDGQVEILTTSWFRDRRGYKQWMWIFSWNGLSGNIINQINPADGNSVIQGIYFEFIDADSDGVQEIRAASSMDTTITYGWNGIQYGLWPGTPQIDQRTFLPANRLTPSVDCTVSIESSSYVYRYDWFNAPQSVQAISRIYLRRVASSCAVSGPERWLTAVWPDSPVVGWNAILNFADMVKPGQSKSGFGLVSSGLPTIADYYVQGNRPPPMESSEDPEISTEEYRNDIFTNSATGRTISPADPPVPFDGLGFLDTIKSYINESRTLGWITSQPTADKYARLVDSAKSKLQAGQLVAARARLDTVLINVHTDSASTLTSEAYALLRFNTEYVLSQLPQPTTFTLSVSTIGNGSVTRDPNLPAYDSALTVQLTAVPSSGYHFIQWSGSVGGSQNPLSLLMNSNKSITATFKSDAELAEENTSSSPDATASNNARHLVRYDTYLHEVFTSGGGIFHRRSTNGGATWDQTHQLSTDPDNSHPCITTTRSGSVHVVWQRSIDASTYEVWHSVSQDHGESWSTPVILPDAGSVQVSEYQTDGTMPVIAELIESSLLVVVYCSQDGLLFTSSPDDGIHWESVDGISGQYNDRVRAPSLAGGLTSVSLVYDYAGDDLGPYSRVFNGSSWSSEASLGEWTDVRYGSSASVATDPEDLPIAAWSGTSSIFGLGKVIVFRPGLADNSWSEWYTMFGEGFTDWLHPSITYHNSPEQGAEYGVAIAHHTSWGAVHLIRLTGDSKEYNWGVSTLSSSGAWASITPDLQSDEADFCWTEQSAFPHQVIVGSTSELAMRSPVHLTHMRRAVLHRRTSGDTLAVEFGTMKIVDADGDTSRVHFKAVPLRQRGRITSSTMWEYLGSDTVQVPSNARRLIVEKQFHGTAQRSFTLRVLSPEGNTLGTLDTTSTSGVVSLNIAPYAGRSVILRPHVTLSGIDPQRVRISVGDVFTVPEDPGRRRTR